MVPLSVLDLATVASGSTPAQALGESTRLAAIAEELGFHRFWVAEHHGMPAVASSAPAVLIAHLASATSTIRVGSGGVMLPNHAPLVIAEQFATLEALHPGRIDLGLGRAPGTDPLTARALRRDAALTAENFPEDVVELYQYFAGAANPAPTPEATSRRRCQVGSEAHSDTRLAVAAPISWGAASRPSETPIPTVTIEITARAMLGTRSSRPDFNQIASETSVPPVDRRPSTRSPTTTMTAAPISAAIRRQPGACSARTSRVWASPP